MKNCYRCVRHPAAGLHLVGIEAPEFEFFLEEWSAHVRWVMQFARPVSR